MLREIQSVTDNEIIGNFKAAVINRNVDFAAARLIEERTNFYAVRLLVKKIFDKKIHRSAGVDNVFHKQNISALRARC